VEIEEVILIPFTFLREGTTRTAAAVRTAAAFHVTDADYYTADKRRYSIVQVTISELSA